MTAPVEASTAGKLPSPPPAKTAGVGVPFTVRAATVGVLTTPRVSGLAQLVSVDWPRYGGLARSWVPAAGSMARSYPSQEP